MIVLGVVAICVVAAFAGGWCAGWLRSQRVGQRGAHPASDATTESAIGLPSLPEVVERHTVGVAVADADGVIIYRNGLLRSRDGSHVGVLLDEAIERHVITAGRNEARTESLGTYGPPRQVFLIDSHAIDNGVVVFVHDVSERDRIDRVRTDFVANISHELKTPVGALVVLAEMLAGEDDPTMIARLARRIGREADRATDTIDNLLELSRIELDGGSADTVVDLGSVFRQVSDRVAEVADQRGVSLSFPAGATELSASLSGDERQLVSAMGNLVENAVKYSDPGSAVRVEVSVANAHVELAVSDQGVGIPQRDLDRVFERFYRVDGARSRDTGGTGLGLSIVRHVAANHGGDVSVTSIEGAGSTFVLRIPLADPDGRVRADAQLGGPEA